MPLMIKTDEDLPGSVTDRLRGAGYLAETVVEEGKSGTNDPALWRAVQAEGRFLSEFRRSTSAPQSPESTPSFCSQEIRRSKERREVGISFRSPSPLSPPPSRPISDL